MVPVEAVHLDGAADLIIRGGEEHAALIEGALDLSEADRRHVRRGDDVPGPRAHQPDVHRVLADVIAAAEAVADRHEEGERVRARYVGLALPLADEDDGCLLAVVEHARRLIGHVAVVSGVDVEGPIDGTLSVSIGSDLAVDLVAAHRGEVAGAVEEPLRRLERVALGQNAQPASSRTALLAPSIVAAEQNAVAMPVVRQQVRDGVHVVVADVARFRQLEGAAELEGVERLALVEVRYAVILSHGGHLALFLVGVRGEERIQRVLGPVRHLIGELAPDGDARRPRDKQAVSGLHALIDTFLFLLGEVEQARPFQAVHGGLLEEHEEVGVENDVLRGLVVEHRHGVLRDSGEQEAELAALVREAREVVEHRRVGEQRLDLLDVQPCAHAALVVVVHAVSHRLAHVDEREHQHGVRQLAQVEVDDAVVEAHVGRAVEEGHVRYRADIGKFVENEVDGNGQLAVVVDGGAVAQEVDRLPHHDRVQEGEGLVGVGHAGDQRRLRAVRVAHLVKLHLIVLQDLADLAQAYPRQTGVAGDEDGLEGLTGGNAEVVVVAEGDVLIRGEAPAIRRAHVVATALELAGDLDVGRAPAADRHRVAAEGRARRARPTLALLELLARLDLQEQQVEGALEALIALAGLRQR